MLRVTLRVALAGFMLLLLTPTPSQAEEIRLNSIGVRGGVSGSSPIGRQETEYFQQYDVMANWSLPWELYSESGWGVGTRVMGTVGAVTAAGDTAFVSTIVPGLVFGKKDGWLSMEIGGGFALFSQHQFAHQNLGGVFQFVWDYAIRAKVYKGIGVGYWFHHTSDATLYGDNGRGYDLHMIEISYRF
jgi:Lipid A 3-O-deacylase (PagL)